MKKDTFLFITLILMIISLAFSRCDFPNREREIKDYTLSDSTMQEAVMKKLEAHPYVSTGQLDVKAENGFITLTGSVNNILVRDKAIELASMIKGVRGVINLIRVEPHAIGDLELKNNIEYALAHDPVLESFTIGVEVSEGDVNLQGMVTSWHEKNLAEEVTKRVTGVRSVENNIAFLYREDRPDEEIRQDVTSLLRNDMRIQDGLIDVSVEAGAVRLSGKVGNLSEKNIATTLAWVSGTDTVITEDLEVLSEDPDPLMRKDKYIQKLDRDIIRDIEQAYLQDPRLVQHDIQVEIVNDTVVLTGHVSNLRAKKAAGQNARNIVGVWNVKNNITVKTFQPEPPETVADNAKVVIEQHPVLSDRQIVVSDKGGGDIILEGEVMYYVEKVQAEEIVSEVKGVVDITNNLEVAEGEDLSFPVTPDRRDLPVIKKLHIKSDEQLKEDVAYQLWWSPFVDRSQIEIEVDSGYVTLRGTVNTTLEMDHAVENAYEAGAVRVNNELDVEFWEF